MLLADADSNVSHSKLITARDFNSTDKRDTNNKIISNKSTNQSKISIFYDCVGTIIKCNEGMNYY